MCIIKLFSKFLTSDPVKIVRASYATILAENALRNYGFSTSLVYVPRNFYTHKCRKKKPKACMQKHPTLNKPIKSIPDEVKTGRDCETTESCPCVPPPHRPPSKMADIQDCPKSDLFTNTNIKCLREDGKKSD